MALNPNTAGAAKVAPGMNLSEDTLRELGIYLERQIRTGLAERSELKERWDTNEGYYRNEPGSFSIKYLPGAVMYPQPLMQPRIDALCDNVIGTITAQNPYLLGRLRGDAERVEDLENTLQFFFDLGGLEEALKRLGPMVGCTNCGILRADFETVAQGFTPGIVEGPSQASGNLHYAGMRYDVIHPADFVCTPSSVYGIAKARLVGHRFYQIRSDIRQRVAIGQYIADLPVNESGGPGMQEAGRSQTFSKTSDQSTGYKEDEKIECFEVIFRATLKGFAGNEPESKVDTIERWYKATLALATSSILKIEPYHYRRPWYFDFRFKPKEYGGFWPSTSIAQDLQGPQALKNGVRNICYYGSCMSAFPPIVSTGEFEKDQVYGPGTFVGSTGGEVKAMDIRFNPGVLEWLDARIDQDADSVARVNQAALAQQYSRDMTATEASQLAAGQQTGVSAYIGTFGAAIVELAEHTIECLYLNWGVWHPLYGEQAPVQNQQDLLQPVRWQLQGKSSNDSPQVMVQKLQALYGIAKDVSAANLQQFVQIMGQALKGLGLPDPVIAQITQQVAQAGQSGVQTQLSIPEIIRSMLSYMHLPNQYRILPEEGEGKPNDLSMASPNPDPGMGGNPQMAIQPNPAQLGSPPQIGSPQGTNQPYPSPNPAMHL